MVRTTVRRITAVTVVCAAACIAAYFLVGRAFSVEIGPVAEWPNRQPMALLRGECAAAAVSAWRSEDKALWAVTVGTNMEYTPVFGESVKYVLLGSNEVSELDDPAGFCAGEARERLAVGALGVVALVFVQSRRRVNLRRSHEEIVR